MPSTARSYRQAVGWLPQHVQPMPQLTAREYVAYAGWLKGMATSAAHEKAATALERVNLNEQAEVKTHRLSGGQLRRLGVAATLVHDVQVLLLDEPTAGLDPQQRRTFRDVLTSLTGQVRILMSTHDIQDLGVEADHVTVLQAGRILQNGTAKDFLAQTPPDIAPDRASRSCAAFHTCGAWSKTSVMGTECRARRCCWWRHGCTPGQSADPGYRGLG
ncbi:ABC transporter [Streptomyces atratus]|uniref:ABC transporter n=1 Tax=Streptomyces atratus TaxID=1893 RepID=A0A2Z5J648_STRAR|nr:ABC transporter [Streptomyces atratus]AXE82494.1 ABC transporter [Streptomyces atratus]